MFFATLIGLASVAQGQVPQLVLTENSSTSLTATFNGNPLGVTLVSPDHWTVGLAGVTNRGFGYWEEPNPTTEANQVVGLFTLINVTSDISPQQGAPVAANGATDTTDLSYDGGALDVTFTDNGDAPSSVPDTAGTMSLLALSMVALVILKRSQTCNRAAV